MADDKAMERAVNESIKKALLVHKRMGNPVATWKDGKVAWIAPEDIPV